jgi:protein O-GlcNAc transferase
MAGMFEHHDKSRFEVTGISIGPEDSDEMRQRLLRSFDHFIDAKALSNVEVASRIRETEIDILIDLKGFTQDAQTNIFAQRPAPIQVNYLGYPGTMGASYIDYIIADQTLIPDKARKFYSEKIVVLPNSYQTNDRTRIVSDKVFCRSQVGLPSGVVFCCFNNTYKITPHVFDRWMRILGQVEGSVLWLLEDNASAASNLKKEAAARGVRSGRLVFAERIRLPEHLARHKLADLFLDTLPVNAHTTASDALWAGLPVLTQIGETFAGRVAASLLNAIGLSELITSTPQDYEALAIELATNPEKLVAIKSKLATNRLTTPLFDTQTFTRHIEAAYTMMYERYQADLPPDHISVPK